MLFSYYRCKDKNLYYFINIIPSHYTSYIPENYFLRKRYPLKKDPLRPNLLIKTLLYMDSALY